MENSKEKLRDLININYIVQNLKKSKGILLLIIIVLPLINLLIGINENDSNAFLITEELFSLGIIYRYIIPMVVSYELFSYVFKKQKVDFYASMPISKKTIFISNTIAGIILLFMLNLLILLSSLIPALFQSKYIVIAEQILDNSILLFFSQVVIFTISNIIVSLTGKVRGFLVLSLIFFLIIPVLLDITYDLFFYESTFTLQDEEFIIMDGTNWLPSPIGIGNFSSTGMTWFKGIKNIIYIGVFITIGTILFKKKRLENSEELFKSDIVHELVKGIIFFIPLAEIFYETSLDDILSISFLTLIVVAFGAFILYDIVIGKKVRKGITIGAFVACVFFSLIIGDVVDGIETFQKANTDDEISLSQVKEIGIDLIYSPKGYYNSRYIEQSIYSFSGYFGTDNDYRQFDNTRYILSKDEEIKEIILEAIKNDYKDYVLNNNNSNDSSNYIYTKGQKQKLDIEETKSQESIYKVSIIVKLKNGKIGTRDILLKESEYNKIVSRLEDKKIEKYLNNRIKLNKAYVSERNNYKRSYPPADKQTANEIKTNIKDAIDDLDLHRLSEMINTNYPEKDSENKGLLEIYYSGRLHSYYILPEATK